MINPTRRADSRRADSPRENTAPTARRRRRINRARAQQPSSPAERAHLGKSDFETEPGASGKANFLGARAFGPEVFLSESGKLHLKDSKNGKQDIAAVIETARLIETGLSPFAHKTKKQLEGALRQLTSLLKDPAVGPGLTDETVQPRSAIATTLLSLAWKADGTIRKDALNAYISILSDLKTDTSQTHEYFAKSMIRNLKFKRIPLSEPQRITVKNIGERLKPRSFAYTEWFKPGDPKPEFHVRQYVMEDFWKDAVSANVSRGFKLISNKNGVAEFKGKMKDPKGVAPDTAVSIIMRKDHNNVLRDLADPKVNFVIYSGHSQYGAVLDESIRNSPHLMKGRKGAAFLACNTYESASAIGSKHQDLDIITTKSSSYDSDDRAVVDALYKTVQARQNFSWLRQELKKERISSNYNLPGDEDAQQDDDQDGIRNESAIGADWFFDPAKLHADGGTHRFQPAEKVKDPQLLSGQKLNRAVGYANVAFHYFGEENEHAPRRHVDSETFVSRGWKNLETDDAVSIQKTKLGNKTTFEIWGNARYASRSRDVMVAETLYAIQKFLAADEVIAKKNKRDIGFDENDKLRVLIMVATYADLYLETSTQCDQLLKGFAQKHGYKGPVNYDVMREALLKDGDEGTATDAAVDFLREQGISAPIENDSAAASV